jgi:hypothetical protein
MNKYAAIKAILNCFKIKQFKITTKSPYGGKHIKNSPAIYAGDKCYAKFGKGWGVCDRLPSGEYTLPDRLEFRVRGDGSIRVRVA